jgi:hypothetical protein
MSSIPAIANTTAQHHHQIIRFNPAKYRLQQAACDYGIKEARRIKDWAMLEQAVDAKIAEQIKFIAWWYANVSINYGGDRKHHQVSGSRYLPYREAERLTGMKQPRISELRQRLQHPDEYRLHLLGAAYRAAMLEAIPTCRLGHGGRIRNESYTPAQYIELVRQVFGGEIDLDVASCEQAQKTVQANRFFIISDNALKQDWYGKVFSNPPYSHPDIALFTDKLLHEIANKHVTSAIMLTNNSTDTAWFQKAAAAATAICFTRGRIRFISCDGTNPYTPVQGQAFFYFGNDLPAFMRHFEPVGFVVLPYPDLRKTVVATEGARGFVNRGLAA